MIVLFQKDCGIYAKGDAVEVARPKGEQYINGGFAVEATAGEVKEEPVAKVPEEHLEPVAESPVVKKAPEKKAPVKKPKKAPAEKAPAKKEAAE